MSKCLCILVLLCSGCVSSIGSKFVAPKDGIYRFEGGKVWLLVYPEQAASYSIKKPSVKIWNFTAGSFEVIRAADLVEKEGSWFFEIPLPVADYIFNEDVQANLNEAIKLLSVYGKALK